MKQILSIAILTVIVMSFDSCATTGEKATSSSTPNVASPQPAQNASSTQPVQNAASTSPAQNVQATQSVRSPATVPSMQTNTLTQPMQNAVLAQPVQNAAQTKSGKTPTKSKPNNPASSSTLDLEKTHLQIRVLTLEIKDLRKDIENDEREYNLLDRRAKNGDDIDSKKYGDLAVKLGKMRKTLTGKESELVTLEAKLPKKKATPSVAPTKTTKAR